MSYFDIGREPRLEPPEPKEEYCCVCGNVATEYWSKTDSVYCMNCAFDKAYDWLTSRSINDTLDLAGFENTEPYGRT